MFSVETSTSHTIGVRDEHNDNLRFAKRGYGGWNVVLDDTDRIVGWVAWHSESELWAAYISCSAFRGDGPNDEGDILDDVPFHLYKGTSFTGARQSPVGYGAKREEAVYDLMYWLHDNHAPAVTEGAHYAVKKWSDR